MNKRFLIISTILFIIIIITEYIAFVSFNHAGTIRSAGIEVMVMTLGISLPLIFMFSMIYSYKRYSLFNSLLNTISSVWITAISYIFVVSIFISLLISTNNYLDLNIPIRIISNLLIILVILITTYGVWNSSKTKVVRWTIKSDKLSKDWAGKKIVMVSDTHLGSIRRSKFMEKVVNIIKSENPDITFNVGDLIDGSSFPYEKWFTPLSTLSPQLGNHYVEGNHERYSKEYDTFRSQFPKALNDLTDQKITVNNTQIIGLGHIERESAKSIKNRLKLLGHNSEEPSIILIHDPRNVKALSESGASLVLSGHTHGGQFFPFTTIINSLYKQYSYGVAYTKDTVSITSSGVGTSIIPTRTGTSSEIVVITIE